MFLVLGTLFTKKSLYFRTLKQNIQREIAFILPDIFLEIFSDM